MRLLHLADLHFGKSLHNLSLTESGDQRYWVEQLMAFIQQEKPDAVLIAGDVYDRGVPSRDAVQLLSDMLTGIAHMKTPVLMVAGNHDGGERLEFAAGLLDKQMVYIEGTVKPQMRCVTLQDANGPVHFWLMPYVFPAAVRTALQLGEDEAASFTEAVRLLLEAQPIDYSQRNVLIAHQMVAGNGETVEHSPSETSVGGLGGVDAALLKDFDYVALGHIHGAQRAGYEHVRYAGAPLCYHFSEANQKKGPLMVSLGAKGSGIIYETTQLPPLHRVRPTMVGTAQEILAWEKESTARGEYVRVELTDDHIPAGTQDQLRALFASHDCQLLDIGRARCERAAGAEGQAAAAAEELSLEDHFLRFYRKQTGEADPSAKDAALIRLLAQQIGDQADADADRLVDELVEAVLKQEDDAQ